MIQGTTPTLVFLIDRKDITTDEISNLYVTIKQGKVIIEKDKEDITFSAGNKRAFYFTLTQEETLSLTASGICEVQIRALLTDGVTVIASPIYKKPVEALLNPNQMFAELDDSASIVGTLTGDYTKFSLTNSILNLIASDVDIVNSGDYDSILATTSLGTVYFHRKEETKDEQENKTYLYVSDIFTIEDCSYYIELSDKLELKKIVPYSSAKLTGDYNSLSLLNNILSLDLTEEDKIVVNSSLDQLILKVDSAEFFADSTSIILYRDTYINRSETEPVNLSDTYASQAWNYNGTLIYYLIDTDYKIKLKFSNYFAGTAIEIDDWNTISVKVGKNLNVDDANNINADIGREELDVLHETVSTEIDAERFLRELGDSDLTTALNTEKETREAEDNKLLDEIDAERFMRELGDDDLTDSLDQNVDNLQNQLDDINSITNKQILDIANIILF